MNENEIKHVLAMYRILRANPSNDNFVERNWILKETGRDIFHEWLVRHNITEGTIGGSGDNYLFFTDAQFQCFKSRWGEKS